MLGERLTYLALVGLLTRHTDNFRAGNSSLLLSVLANVMLAPVLALAPFTGAWVDRMNLKRVLIVSDVLRAVIVVLIPLLYSTTHATLPVFVLVFALFTCNVFFLPAKSAMTPEIVAPSQLLTANAWLTGAGIAATAAGALLGGWIVDHWGWPLALWINGATYLASVVALLLIRYRPDAHVRSATALTVRGYLAEVAEGWRVVRSHGAVGLALLALGAVWAGGGFLHVAGNQHIQRAASIPGMERVGGLLAALGLGSAIGTWWISHGGRRVNRGLLLGAGLVLAGGGMVVFALSTKFWVFAGAGVIIGFAAAPAFMLTETMLQEGAETRVRGRVFSARDFLMRLVFLISVSIAGWTSDAVGIETTLLLCAGILAIAGMTAIAWGRRQA